MAVIIAELSMGWVDLWVGLSSIGFGCKWVENFCFKWVGWVVMGLKWQICKKPMLQLSAEKLNQLNLGLFIGGCIQD